MGFINGTYKVDFIKNMTKQKRDTSFTKFSITGFKQNMPQSNNWQELLNDSEYLNQLIEMIKQYLLEFGSGTLSRSTFLLLLQEKKNILFLKLIPALLLFLKIRMSLY